MSRKRFLLIILVIAVIAGGSVAAGYYAGVFHVNNSSSSGKTVHFFIFESTQGPCNGLGGMNDSVCHGTSGQWPIMNVQQGDLVIIHVTNNGSTEPHGFMIDHYMSSGLSVSPGQSYNVTFTANKVGTFRVYCQIFCSIHPFMQNGELIVSAS